MSAPRWGNRGERVSRRAVSHQEQRQRNVGVGHCRPRIEVFYRDQASHGSGPVPREDSINAPPACDNAARSAFGYAEIPLNLSGPQISTPVQHRLSVAARDV